MTDSPSSATSTAPVPPVPRRPLVGELTASIAPVPEPRTVQRRTSLPFQLLRFARVNLRMVAMIRRSHSR
jgi:hypothetical protein